MWPNFLNKWFYKWFKTHFLAWKHLFILKKTNWQTINPMISTSPILDNRLPHVHTKETIFKHENVFSRLEYLILSLVLSNFWLCTLGLPSCRIPQLEMRKAFDLCKVKGQPNVGRAKWVCRNYRLTIPSFFITNQTGTPHDETLGLTNLFSCSPSNCLINSPNSEVDIMYGAIDTWLVPGTKSIVK